jgi:hypothetical protein
VAQFDCQKIGRFVGYSQVQGKEDGGYRSCRSPKSEVDRFDGRVELLRDFGVTEPSGLRCSGGIELRDTKMRDS